MRVDDFWIESDSGLGPAGGLRLDLLERLSAGPIAEYTDLEAAIALTRLLDEQFRRYGTDATNESANEESREAFRTLRSLTDRIGVPFDPPYRTVLKKGEATAKGRMVEHTSWRNPGRVSSWVRAPPPAVGAAS